MRIYRRELAVEIRKAAKAFGAVILTGPRRSGKTFLLRRAFPKASYHLLEDPDVIGRIKADPRGWMESVTTPAVLDEVQNVPELFAYVRSRIDGSGGRRGQWFLTGSQDLSLMRGVTESMAGRAAVFGLLPLSFRETGSWNLVRGGFPEVVQRPRSASLWFNSYVQTYLERDVRAVKAVKNLATFRRFIALAAARHGQILNRVDFAAPLSVSVPTVSEWLGVLETTGQIVLVPPFYENFGKRLIKSPRLYWLDSGLVCHLLRIESQRQLEDSPFLGAVFEGFLASEIIKKQINAGRARELYYFRDAQGLEVDFLVPKAAGGMHLIEAKWSRTITPEMARPLTRLRAAMKRRKTEAFIVHRTPSHGEKLGTVVPSVRALGVEEFLAGSSI